MQTNPIDYSKKTRDELIAICKEKGLKGSSAKKKEELISTLSSQGFGDASTNTEILVSATKNLTYIDLFAGIGGFRVGIQAFQALHPEYTFKCVKSADIKKDAIKTYNHNFHETNEACDVRTIKNLPYFDILCGGFPCQPFSSAGKKEGLKDEGRGDLIYEVLRICKESKPEYIILENVSNIENIDKGEALKTILKEFQTIGYHTTCVPINSSQVGLAQDRKRIFIIGCKSKAPRIIIKSKEAVSMKHIID